MIVDVHTHLWEAPQRLGAEAIRRLRPPAQSPASECDASPEGFDRGMEPVDCALVHGFESEYLNVAITADQVARFVQRWPERYLGFAGIDPLSGRATERVEEAIELGLRGVTLSPAAQNMHPADTRAMALYESCQARGMPVLFNPGLHLSSSAVMEFSQPHLLDEVARSFPELRLIIGHAGHPFTEQAVVLLGKHKFVYAEVSGLVRRPWQLYNFLLSAHQQGAIGRVLLGSNFPQTTPEQAIAAVYSVNGFVKGSPLTPIPREHLRGIVERDALVCLGLSRPQPTDRSGATSFTVTRPEHRLTGPSGPPARQGEAFSGREQLP